MNIIMAEMYLKIIVSSKRKQVEHCFMRANVELKEIQDKVNEIKILFDKDEEIKLAIGY